MLAWDTAAEALAVAAVAACAAQVACQGAFAMHAAAPPLSESPLNFRSA